MRVCEMDLELRGEPALITGVSEGVGRARAAALAREFSENHIPSRTKSKLESAAAGIRAEHGTRVCTYAYDLANSSHSDVHFGAAGNASLMALVYAIGNRLLFDSVRDVGVNPGPVGADGSPLECHAAHHHRPARGRLPV